MMTVKSSTTFYLMPSKAPTSMFAGMISSSQAHKLFVAHKFKDGLLSIIIVSYSFFNSFNSFLSLNCCIPTPAFSSIFFSTVNKYIFEGIISKILNLDR